MRREVWAAVRGIAAAFVIARDVFHPPAPAPRSRPASVTIYHGARPSLLPGQGMLNDIWADDFDPAAHDLDAVAQSMAAHREILGRAVPASPEVATERQRANH